MTPVRVASLLDLRDRLETALGPDSLLFERLSAALSGNETTVDAALDCLAASPRGVQATVEDVVLDWLSGSPSEPAHTLLRRPQRRH